VLRFPVQHLAKPLWVS